MQLRLHGQSRFHPYVRICPAKPQAALAIKTDRDFILSVELECPLCQDREAPLQPRNGSRRGLVIPLRKLMVGTVIFGLSGFCFFGTSALCVTREETLAPAVTNPREVIWRSERACGLNCLYVLLGAYNIPVEYEELTAETLRKEKYTSLTDLKEAAKRYGLNGMLGKTDPDGLAKLPKPIIVHMDVVRQRTGSTGHFVLVLRTTPQSVECMEGTSGSILNMPWREFQRCWSGHVMYVSNGEHSVSLFSMALSILVGVFCAVLIDRYFVQKLDLWGFCKAALSGRQRCASRSISTVED